MTTAKSAPIESLRAIAIAVRAGNLEEAANLAEAALAAGAEHPMLLNLRAWRREQNGRFDEALDDLTRARQIAPGDVTTLNALGLALANLDRMAEAVEAFSAAAAAAPTFLPAHFNLGWALEALGELDAARASHERAAALDPKAAAPLASLAALAARRGDWSEARRLGEAALALDPRQPNGVLAMAGVELAAGSLEAAKDRLADLLSWEGLSTIDLALAHGLMGDVLDAQDRPRQAFPQYEAANSALRDRYRRRFEGASETMPQWLAWVTDYFLAAARPAWGPTPPPAVDPAGPAGHVFLVGFPRSGTTLLEQVLARGADVVTLEEKDTLAPAVREFMTKPAGLDRLGAIEGAALAAQRAAYWDRVAQLGALVAGKVVVDKLPLNSMKLPIIAKLFPTAKIVFALRDPRDVILSCFRQRFAMNASMYEFLTLAGAARFYDGVMALAEIFRATLSLELIVHRYEDLVGDFEGRARAVCAFTGIAWSEAMRDFATRADGRAVATPSSAQVARGLYVEGAGRWRRYAADLAPVLPILAPWVSKWGYPNPSPLAGEGLEQ